MSCRLAPGAEDDRVTAAEPPDPAREAEGRARLRELAAQYARATAEDEQQVARKSAGREARRTWLAARGTEVATQALGTVLGGIVLGGLITALGFVQAAPQQVGVAVLVVVVAALFIVLRVAGQVWLERDIEREHREGREVVRLARIGRIAEDYGLALDTPTNREAPGTSPQPDGDDKPPTTD